MSSTTTTEAWVVVVSETIDGETTCQVVSDEFATEEEAEVFACDLAYRNPKAEWEIEVCTAEQAAGAVTD